MYAAKCIGWKDWDIQLFLLIAYFGSLCFPEFKKKTADDFQVEMGVS